MKIKHSTVILSTIALLSLPLLLFVVFWLSFMWAIPLCLFSFYVVKDFIPYIKTSFQETYEIKPIILLTSSILIVIWILYGGIGKIGYQNFDYVKHNSIYHDLLNIAWPVQSVLENETYYLVYYFGYYIVPAIVGKIFNSYLALEITAIIQAFLGLNLFFIIISIITGKKNIFLICLVFILWGGLDIYGNLIFKQGYSETFGEFPEWWAGASNFQFTGFTDLLYWVPQHAMGGWLCTALCLLFLQNNVLRIMPLIAAISLAWSPFVCIGLLPMLLVSFISQQGFKQKIEWCLSRYGVFALIFLFVLMSYYSTSSFEQPFQWQLIKMGVNEFLQRYFVFLALEIFLPIIFIFYYRKTLSSNMRLFFYLTIIFLAFAPHIYLGVYSDFAMRASIPGLFSIFVLVLTVFDFKKLSFQIKVFSILFLACISYSAFSDFYRAQVLKKHELGYGPTKVFAADDIGKQYLGKKNHSFFKIFFKQ